MKENKGITLIALIITIIVMLILVAVSVRLIINSNILGTAKKAGENYEEKQAEESNLSFSILEIDGKKYATYQDYLNNKEWIDLPENWIVAEKPEGWSKNVTAITDGTNIVPLPSGYEVSKVADEQTIDGGLVIIDANDNEFVWIPITTNFTESYKKEPSAPRQITEDYEDVTQNYLDRYYGENYYILTDFENAMVSNYEEMVTSVNKYDGFYIGRYETTIDGANIGSKAGTTILTANMEKSSGIAYRWWGLYDVQRSANVTGNGSIVQTNMVWGQQWYAMITYFDSKNATYSGDGVLNLVNSGLQRAGQSMYNSDGLVSGDEICNVYDLRRNAFEWIARSNVPNLLLRLPAFFRCSCFRGCVYRTGNRCRFIVP